MSQNKLSNYACRKKASEISIFIITFNSLNSARFCRKQTIAIPSRSHSHALSEMSENQLKVLAGAGNDEVKQELYGPLSVNEDPLILP